MRLIYSAIAVMLWSANAIAQHQEITAKPDMWKGKQENSVDTSSLLYAFKSGCINPLILGLNDVKGLTFLVNN